VCVVGAGFTRLDVVVTLSVIVNCRLVVW